MKKLNFDPIPPQPSDLIIIAARPGMGKTAFMLSIAKNMAIDNNTPTAIFTLEMSGTQLTNRLLSNVANLESEAIKEGKLSDDEWIHLNHCTRSVSNAPLYIDDTAELSISELQERARRLVREQGVKLILIDYLQLIKVTDTKADNGNQDVSTITRSLKALAKELNIPIVAMSMLSRCSGPRDNVRPTLSDLPMSEAIEQDADIIGFIHRPEHYSQSPEEADGNEIRGKAELIIAKNRNGAVGTIDLRYMPRYNRFENRE